MKNEKERNIKRNIPREREGEGREGERGRERPLACAFVRTCFRAPVGSFIVRFKKMSLGKVCTAKYSGTIALAARLQTSNTLPTPTV